MEVISTHRHNGWLKTSSKFERGTATYAQALWQALSRSEVLQIRKRRIYMAKGGMIDVGYEDVDKFTTYPIW